MMNNAEIYIKFINSLSQVTGENIELLIQNEIMR